MSHPLLFVDNGAHRIKSIFLKPGGSSTEPYNFRNAIAASKRDKRSYMGREIDEDCMDYGGLTFQIPFERGMIVQWDVEKLIWDALFGPKGLKINTTKQELVMTIPPLPIPTLPTSMYQLLFETYSFPKVLLVPVPVLASFAPIAEGAQCTLVVDSGFSCTWITPVIRGRVFAPGVRRVDVGGKVLTNYLKELISYRQWYMMDQTSVMEHMKEESCFVSMQWQEDLEAANQPRNHLVQTFVLPDFAIDSTNRLGYIKDDSKPAPAPEASAEEPMIVDLEASTSSDGNAHSTKQPARAAAAGVKDTVRAEKALQDADYVPEGGEAPKSEKGKKRDDQTMQMCSERFVVPEVLYNPSIIGMNEAPLSEAIAESVESLPLYLQGMFWDNIVCIGGNVGFANFTERLQKELRELAPVAYDVSVRCDSSPKTTALAGAEVLCSAKPRSPSTVPVAEQLEDRKRVLDQFVVKDDFMENPSIWTDVSKNLYFNSTAELEAFLA